MSVRTISLRTQLLLLGIGATVVPIFALLSVVLATSTSSEIVEGPAGELTVGETESGAVPPVVIIAACGLAVGALAAVWIWSNHAVQPMREITRLANDMQAGSLDRRLHLGEVASEVKELGDSFDRMLDRLEQSSRTQHQLIEDASHELRTPLAALAVNNEIIRSHPDPTQADHDESLARSGALIARLQNSIDELLLGARTRSRQTGQVDNDVMAIVRRAVDQHHVLHPEIAVVVSGPDELRLGIDGPSIERALANLLDNAARFAPGDKPIEVDVIDADPPTLTVTDHGPGLAPEDLPRVFDRYFRADQAEGHGIGLAVVKQIADAHGSIKVESPATDAGTGTRFVITFDVRSQVSSNER